LQQHPLLRGGNNQAGAADLPAHDHQGAAPQAGASGFLGDLDAGAPTSQHGAAGALLSAATPATCAQQQPQPQQQQQQRPPPSPPRSPEYEQGRADGYLEALLRKDNDVLREALEAERRATAFQQGRLDDLERQLAAARERAAGAEASLSAASDALDQERRRAERALQDLQREGERRMAAEERAAAADGERR
jgi:hypothetical protein